MKILKTAKKKNLIELVFPLYKFADPSSREYNYPPL